MKYFAIATLAVAAMLVGVVGCNMAVDNGTSSVTPPNGANEEDIGKGASVVAPTLTTVEKEEEGEKGEVGEKK